MSIDFSVLLLVLLSAVMHAAWNALVRSGDDTLISLFLVKAPTMLVAAGVLLVTGLPAMESVPFMMFSTMVTAGYFYFLTNAYKVGDLSVCYPVARGVAPVSVLLLSVFVFDEVATLSAYVGVAIVSFGVLILAWRSNKAFANRKGLAWAAGVGLTIAGYTVSDGAGARISSNPIGYTAMHSIMTGIVLCTAVIYLRGYAAAIGSLRYWQKGLAGGTLMFSAYAIVVYALTLAPVPTVAALRETGVIFAAFIGTVILKEPLGKRRVLASVFVALGVAILVLGR